MRYLTEDGSKFDSIEEAAEWEKYLDVKKRLVEKICEHLDHEGVTDKRLRTRARNIILRWESFAQSQTVE